MKLMKRNAVVHLASVLWRHAEGYRVRIVCYLLLSTVAIVSSLLPPLVIGKLLTVVQESSRGQLLSQAVWLLTVFVALQGVCWVFHGPSRLIEMRTAFLVQRLFQGSLFRKVTALPLRWHKDHHSGETIDQVARAASALGEFAQSSFEVLCISVRFLGGLGMLVWVMPWTGLVMAVFGALAMMVVVVFDRSLVQQYAVINKRMNGVAAAIQDYLTNVSTVISLRLQGRVALEVDRRHRAVAPLWSRMALTNETKWCLMEAILRCAHGGVLFGYIAFAVYAERVIEIGTLYMLNEYLRSINDSVFHFTSKYADFVTKSTQVHAIDHIEEAFDGAVRAVEHARLPEGWRTIDIVELSFVHDAESVSDSVVSASLGIRNISLTLERGKSYAFVGESGSGKSTTLKLLRGLLEGQIGAVRCDGIKLPYGLAHVAHHTTLIPQDPELFADTIRFNVCMGVESSDVQIKEVLEKARFTQVLARLPRGLDTSIAEKGVNLSGGEKQRLAVARGLFFAVDSGSDLILLDEPTSSVDIRNERLIYQGLLRDLRQQVVLTAIHKFNLLHLFDEVLVFLNGEIVQRGTVNALLQQGGEFRRLWSAYASEGGEEIEAA